MKHFLDINKLIPKLVIAFTVPFIVMVIEISNASEESKHLIASADYMLASFLPLYVVTFAVVSLVPIYDAFFGSKI